MWYSYFTANISCTIAISFCFKTRYNLLLKEANADERKTISSPFDIIMPYFCSTTKNDTCVIWLRSFFLTFYHECLWLLRLNLGVVWFVFVITKWYTHVVFYVRLWSDYKLFSIFCDIVLWYHSAMITTFDILKID